MVLETPKRRGDALWRPLPREPVARPHHEGRDNPIADDGDAFRLMVDLDLTVQRPWMDDERRNEKQDHLVGEVSTVNNVLYTVIVGICLFISGLLFGVSVTRGSIEDDCKALGSFRSNDRVYICERKDGK